MDVAYDSMLVGGWEAWLDALILNALLVAALPLAVVALLTVAVVAIEPRTVRRRFRCALHQREVEVHFASHGLSSGPVAVLSCSVFEPGQAVACHRRCMDPSYRRQWAPPLGDARLPG